MFCSVIKRKVSHQAILSIPREQISAPQSSAVLIFALNSIGLLEMVRVTEHTRPSVERKWYTKPSQHWDEVSKTRPS
jgi:hypothetical protein